MFGRDHIIHKTPEIYSSITQSAHIGRTKPSKSLAARHTRTMVPYLEVCPAEVVENIVSQLGLDDIRSLRRCSRSLAAKATQNHFKSYCRLKHVDLTRSALQDFVEATRPGRLGCLIQDLVLVGIVHNTKRLEAILRGAYKVGIEERERVQQDLDALRRRRDDYIALQDSSTDVKLLSEAFNNLMSNSTNGKLRSLSLAVVVYRKDAVTRLPPASGGGWKLTWQTATRTFHTVFESLATSGIPVERLNIFRDDYRCSLAGNELNQIKLSTEGLTTSLASLKSLSVSFSDMIVEISYEDTGDTGDSADEIDWDAADHERPASEIQEEVDEESNFVGLARILQRCSQLEYLELHHYDLDMTNLIDVSFPGESFMKHISETVTLPRLNKCVLRGVSARLEDLLAFLNGATALRDLSLEAVSLISGTFRSIFDYCTSEAAGLERVYFDDLWEYGLVYFDSPGKPKFRALDHPTVNTLHRTGEEVRRAISYCVPQDFFPGSPSLDEWRRRRRREYGPP